MSERAGIDGKGLSLIYTSCSLVQSVSRKIWKVMEVTISFFFFFSGLESQDTKVWLVEIHGKAKAVLIETSNK